MNDLDAVDTLRRHDGHLPEDARHRARLALQVAIREERVGRPNRVGALARPGRFRWVALVGATAAAAAAVATMQLPSPAPGGSATVTASSTEAVVVLDRAARAASTTPALAVKPNQFVYVRMVNLVAGQRQVSESWVSADGTKAGRETIVGGPAAGTTTIPPARAAAGLLEASYLDVAALPTDPKALLAQLRADPSVTFDHRVNGVPIDVGVWSLLRHLFEDAPPAQKTALFRAAALIPGITKVAQSEDALGRRGEAVALTDPRLGQVQFVFDPTTYQFLGERIIQPQDGATQFIDAVDAVGVVDELGARPAAAN